MKVTVIGSYRTENNRLLGDKANFELACKSLGRILAQSKHRLIVPHPDKSDTAEAHALIGFKEVAPTRFTAVSHHQNDPDLKAHFDAVEKSDAVILIGGMNGTYAAGLSALRRRKLLVPIPAFGGSAKDLCDIAEIENFVTDELRNLTFEEKDWASRMAGSVITVLRAFPRVLLIHGRGDTGQALMARISEASQQTDSPLFGIDQPVIMDLSGKGAEAVPEVFDEFASSVSAAIAIVTADDIGGMAKTENGRDVSAISLTLDRRARENVWVEVGWFWGRLGRERVFLWLKDDVGIPSDLQGAAWTRAVSLDQAWESISTFLQKLRFPEKVRSDNSPTAVAAA